MAQYGFRDDFAPLKKVRVKGGEGWVKGQRHPSPV